MLIILIGSYTLYTYTKLLNRTPYICTLIMLISSKLKKIDFPQLTKNLNTQISFSCCEILKEELYVIIFKKRMSELSYLILTSI